MEFKIPSILFDAEDYTSLMSWREDRITELPLTRNLAGESGDIESCIDFPKYPCHTDAFERMVKLVTEFSDASSSGIFGYSRVQYLENLQNVNENSGFRSLWIHLLDWREGPKRADLSVWRLIDPAVGGRGRGGYGFPCGTRSGRAVWPRCNWHPAFGCSALAFSSEHNDTWLLSS